MDAATDWVSSRYGGALDFDGYNDYGSVAGLNFVNAITVAGWALTTTTVSPPHGEQELVSQDINAARTFDAGLTSAGLSWNIVHWAVFSSSGVTVLKGTSPVALNAWHHLVFTYRFISSGSSVMRIYLDGVLEGETTSAVGPLFATTRPVNIGRREYTSSTSNWNGQISDLRLYDRELSSNEVNALYARPFDLYSPAVGTFERYYERVAPPQIITPSASQTNKITLTRTLFT
jgi:hypothetical protein